MPLNSYACNFLCPCLKHFCRRRCHRRHTREIAAKLTTLFSVNDFRLPEAFENPPTVHPSYRSHIDHLAGHASNITKARNKQHCVCGIIRLKTLGMLHKRCSMCFQKLGKDFNKMMTKNPSSQQSFLIRNYKSIQNCTLT